MEIVVNLEPFVKSLSKASSILDILNVSRDIAKNTALESKKKSIEILCERRVEEILGSRWNRSKSSDSKFFCIKCGKEVSPSEIKRNGHSKKGLTFDEGYTKLSIPLLVHKECLGTIQISWPLLEKRKRFWFDIMASMTSCYFEGVGLRGVSRIFSFKHASSIGIMSVWRIIQRIGNTLNKCSVMPSVKNVKAIGLDEIFMRLRIFRGKGKKAEKKQIYGLVAKSIGNDPSLLSFSVSRQKDEKAWIAQLESLNERGVNFENGLTTAVMDGSPAIASAVSCSLPFVKTQECVFHVQKDLIKLLKEKYGKESLRVKNTIKLVKSLFRATSLKEAIAGIEKVSSKSMFAYQFLKSKQKHMFNYLEQSNTFNTNNSTERQNRELKKRLTPINSFKSDAGAENFAAIMLRREFFRPRNLCWITNTFSQLPIVYKPVEKQVVQEDQADCLSAAKTNKFVGSCKRKVNKRIYYDLPIIRTSNNFALEKLKIWIDGYSILENG